MISCVAKTIASNNSSVTATPEKQFVDELYPWFETRMAPMQPKRLTTLIKEHKLKEISMILIYIIWCGSMATPKPPIPAIQFVVPLARVVVAVSVLAAGMKNPITKPRSGTIKSKAL